ncbi:MAG: hypothetical protein AAGF97_12375, partial [Planctomycetota bacterium]
MTASSATSTYFRPPVDAPLRRPIGAALRGGLVMLIVGTGMLHGSPASSAQVLPTPAKGTGSKPPRAERDAPRTLWPSPTGGPPLTLACVPQGVKCLVHVNL